ncbi:zf-TFIIB domain-containing protein [Halorientalis pallida]|uniref:TFIIB-type zinc ribbon-containing protein n=1 Tax=Halorientalis pallida TaxID=2479928 RepID=UPI003C6F846E
MTASNSLNCLACGTTLDQRTEHGVTIDYCPNCGGVWLDPGELEQLTGHESHSHHRDVDVDIEGEEEAEDEGGILGTIAGALGGDAEDGEFEDEGEMDTGFEEEEDF